MNKTLLQVSGLYVSVLKLQIFAKYFVQIYRAQYGAAMLV